MTDLTAVGFEYRDALNLLRSLRDNPTPNPKKMRSHCYKSPNMADRNNDVVRALEMDFVSTVSDRSEDNVMMDGVVTPLRFLDQSVQFGVKL